jgi:putative two-component system response regulator
MWTSVVVMNQHPEMGAHILGSSRIPLFRMAAEVALSHHERWDGKGYPAGLSGEAIPLSGRIAAIADFFDAVTMDRCYRAAFSDERRWRCCAPSAAWPSTRAWWTSSSPTLPQLMGLRDRVNHIAPTFADLVAGLPDHEN